MKIAPKWLAWSLRKLGFAGITLPPFGIFITPERFDDAALARHESVHWAQYQRMGLLKFYAAYVWYSLRYGYQNNPMEIEARAA